MWLSVRSLVDFGDSGTGDPMWNIATMVLWDPALMQPVLAGYDAGFRTIHTIHTIRPYVILRHLAAIGRVIENGFDASRHIRELQCFG